HHLHFLLVLEPRAHGYADGRPTGDHRSGRFGDHHLHRERGDRQSPARLHFPREEIDSSRSFTSARSVWFTGVGTPISPPRRTTKPFSASISVRLRRWRSCAVDE